MTAIKFLAASLSVMAALFLLASCSSKNNPSPSSAQVLETLSNQGFSTLIVPISPLTPTSSTTDLATLNTFIADKQIVALGESTHGTSEFVTFRHRMIQHMVQQLDFRVLAIEANFSTAQAINDYILGGSGTAVEAVQKISGWVYNNQEFVQLLEWLRNYNNGQSSANKVRFYGFDAQQADAGAVRVQKFISENDPSYLSNFNSTAEPFLNDFAELLQYDLGQLEKMISGFVAQYQTRWSTITSYLQTNKAALVAKSGSREYELTLRHWEIVKQTFNQYVYISDELKANNFRDAYMADNVDWIQKFEGNRKMIVWAHVGHAGNDNSLTTQMGYLLKQNYQTKYYTVGFFTNGGSVRVVDLDKKALGVTKIDPKPEHVITQAFALGKWSQFFLPVSAVNANVELSKLFSTPQKVYFIGSTLEKSTVEQKLGVYYDAIVFIEKTNGTTPN